MKRTEILPVAFILSIFIVIFWAKILFTGQTLFFRDTFLQFFPWQEFASASFRGGEIPLWNPYSMCGTPFLANLQSAVFYPLKIIFYLLPFAEALKLFIFSNTLLGGLFMFFFVKSFKLSDESAGLATLVFMFNGYLVNRAEFLSVFAASVWLPLIALAFKRFSETFKAGWFIVLACSLCMPIFAGGAYIWLYNLVFLVCFLFYYLRTDNRHRVKRTAYFALAILTALALSAVQLLPFIEYLLNSSRRSGLGTIISSVASLPPEHLLEFLVPDLFGNPLRTAYPLSGGITHYWALTFYCGLIPAMLAFAFAVKKSSRITLLFACVAGTAVFISLGAYNPFYVALLKAFPFLSIMRYPATILYLTVFSMAALTAFGFENLIKQAEKTKKGGITKILAVFLILAVVFAVALFWIITTPSILDTERLYMIKKALFTGISLSAGVVVIHLSYRRRLVSKDIMVLAIILFVFIDLLLNGLNVNPVIADNAFSVNSQAVPVVNAGGKDKYRILVDPRTHAGFSKLFLEDSYGGGAPFDRRSSVSEAKKLLFQNYNIAEKIESANSYDPMAPGEQENQFMTMMNSLGKNRLLDIYNVKYVFSYERIIAPELELIAEQNRIKIYKNSSCLPRIFVSALLPKDVGGALNSVSGMAGSKASIIEYRNREVVIETETDAPGWLVLTDTLYPGWKAYVDDKQVEIKPAYKTFRAVNVMPGKHNVRFIYDSMIFKIGAAITLFSLICVALAGVLFWKRKI
ncbi:MAG: YfhO family protein [Candidatus Firestonebacteria bacterium]